MSERFLHEELTTFYRYGGPRKEVPDYLTDNLNPKYELRDYQKEAFARFFHCLHGSYEGKKPPLHFLFNMATGSGKTLIMAGLILYLYKQGYRNFIFFVHFTNILAKTKDNFLNRESSKYLFNETIRFGDKRVKMTPVHSFDGTNPDDISICFTTIQQLHSDLITTKENALTYEDFKEKEIVLLADEAHHLSASTQSKSPSQKLLANLASWENTVLKIFDQNRANLLLEFTATLDYSDPNIVDKYRNKVIYQYDLKDFRHDGFSKDIITIQSDFNQDDRIIQALILNQYKQYVAAKHGIDLKPVILFKAQRTVDQSEENKLRLHTIVNDLQAVDVNRIRTKSNLPSVRRAFAFYDEQGISSHQLVRRLRHEFRESCCISVNRDSERAKLEILLNSLEDNDNHIRAIFAVQKLNEGWDVLNLFDIVRCYETRDTRNNKPGKTTIAEAQLIGRGARYFPFATEEHPNLYMRKYDDDPTAELRMLEELHYHSVNNSRYIAELTNALIDVGMWDERKVQKTLRLKDSFKKTDFYKYGLIYVNERVPNEYKDKRSLSDMGVSSKPYTHSISTGKGLAGAVFGEQSNSAVIPEPANENVHISDIPLHIIKNALARYATFTFKSLKTYFPYLCSMSQFIQDGDYLGGLSITFYGDREALNSISNRDYFDGVLGMLGQIETVLRKNATAYKGTDTFTPQSIKDIFDDKTLTLRPDSIRADGYQEFVATRPWYVFDANFGTSEEKAFVQALESQISWLTERYDEIYLARNERHFKIYNFADGQAFEPDFVLFLRDKRGNLLTYQMFIEPKGAHLIEYERWKEQFLQEVTERFAGETINFDFRGLNQHYRLVGLPFYNSENERNFIQALREAVLGSVS